MSAKSVLSSFFIADQSVQKGVDHPRMSQNQDSLIFCDGLLSILLHLLFESRASHIEFIEIFRFAHSEHHIDEVLLESLVHPQIEVLTLRGCLLGCSS